jgi:hypothetical protein
MTTPIVAAGSIDVFFHEVVEGAIKARQVDVTDGAASYLVSLLSDYAKPDALAEAALDRPLAFQLDEALHTIQAGERFDKLRALGDGVLYTCGFFGDHFEARGIDPAYLFGIGTTAYGAASSMLRVGSSRDVNAAASRGPDIFGELAEKFAAVVTVLVEVADHTVAAGVASSRGLIKMYERYLKTKSPSLEKALSSHGFVTGRGTRGGGKGFVQ